MDSEDIEDSSDGDYDEHDDYAEMHDDEIFWEHAIHAGSDGEYDDIDDEFSHDGSFPSSIEFGVMEIGGPLDQLCPRRCSECSYVRSVLRTGQAPHSTIGNPDFQPLDAASCGITPLASSKDHPQTCDSCCSGPVGPDGMRHVSVIHETMRQPFGREGAVQVLPVEDVSGYGRDNPPIVHSQKLQVSDSRLFGSPVRVEQCYSMRWAPDCSYMGITTASSRLQFWSRLPGEAEKGTLQYTNSFSRCEAGSPVPNLQPCGNIRIPGYYEDRVGDQRDVFSVLLNNSAQLMLNCIRFGAVAGATRAIVSGQNGAIYVFELPTPSEHETSKTPKAADFLCHSLRRASAAPRYGKYTALVTELLSPSPQLRHEGKLMPVVLEDRLLEMIPDLREIETARQALRRPVPDECIKETLALAMLLTPINCAEPSPDGRWIAVLIDAMQVMLLPEALDYNAYTGMNLQWPSVVQSDTQNAAIGCQYAAWSSDGRFLAVSSDSHKAVSVWEICLKSPDALDAEELGQTVTCALAKDAGILPTGTGESPIGASSIPADVAEDHSSFAERVKNGLSQAAGPVEAALNGIDEEALNYVEDNRTRQSILQSMGGALWDQVTVRHTVLYSNHRQPCLALHFVEGQATMLCWAEAKARVHIADVLSPAAYQCVHLNTLPMQMAFARGELSLAPAVAESNWGLEVTGSRQAASLRNVPPLQDHSAPQLGAQHTHAMNLMKRWLRGDVTLRPPLSAAVIMALARGEQVDLPASEATTDAVSALQECLDSILENEHEVMPEMAVVNRLLEQVEEARPEAITGVAPAGPFTLCVTTTKQVIKLAIHPSWSPGVKWPLAFNKAARTFLAVAKFGAVHAKKELVQDGVHCVWHLPPDAISLIVTKAAGTIAEWLSVTSEDDTEEDNASNVNEVHEDNVTYCGLSKEQCLSAAFLNRLVLPMQLHGGLLGP